MAIVGIGIFFGLIAIAILVYGYYVDREEFAYFRDGLKRRGSEISEALKTRKHGLKILVRNIDLVRLLRFSIPDSEQLRILELLQSTVNERRTNVIEFKSSSVTLSMLKKHGNTERTRARDPEEDDVAA